MKRRKMKKMPFTSISALVNQSEMKILFLLPPTND